MKVTRRLVSALIVVVIVVVLVPSCNLLKLIPRSFDVPADVEWYESGVNVDDGDQVSIMADGVVTITDLSGISGNGPDGNEELGTPVEADVTYGTNVADEQPMPNELYGALHFTVNDRPVENNDGFFSVVVRFLRDPIR